MTGTQAGRRPPVSEDAAERGGGGGKRGVRIWTLRGSVALPGGGAVTGRGRDWGGGGGRGDPA